MAVLVKYFPQNILKSCKPLMFTKERTSFAPQMKQSNYNAFRNRAKKLSLFCFDHF